MGFEGTEVAMLQGTQDVFILLHLYLIKFTVGPGVFCVVSCITDFSMTDTFSQVVLSVI